MSHKFLKTVVVTLSLAFVISCSVDAPDVNMEMDFSPVLSNPNVKAITQDGDGFIWIGTANGLNRYDGSEYRRYYHDSDSNSLSDNHIQDILLDSKYRIWVACLRGVSIYDRERDIFKTITNTTTSNNFKDVVQSSDGTIFFNSILQIARYDEDQDIVVPVYDISMRMFNTRLFIDRYDNLWFFNGHTLCCVDSGDLSLKGEYDVGGYVLCGEILPNDVILLGTYNGVKVFDINRRVFDETDEALNILADSFVDNIVPVGKTDVVICTRRDGQYHYDSATGSVSSRNEQYFPSSIIPDAELQASFMDSGSNLWFGTYDKGVIVNYASVNRSDKFSGLGKLTSGKNVLSVTVDSRNFVWVSTRNGRLEIYDGSQLCDSYMVRALFTEQRDMTRISHIFCDQKGFAWLLSGRRVALFKYEDGKLNFYKLFSFNNDVNSILEDDNGTIWLFTQGRYAYYCRRGENVFQSYDLFEKDSFSAAFEAVISPEGNIIVSVFYNGIIEIDPRTMTKRVSTYPVFTEDTQFLPYDLIIDSRGTLWLGSSKGLFYSDNCNIDHFERVGNQYEAIINVMEDVQGNIWAGTDKYLRMFDRTVGKFTISHTASFRGESEAQFNDVCSTILPDNSLAFGTTDGLVVFDPVDAYLDRQVPVKFKFARVNNADVYPAVGVEKLIIPASANSVAIGYTALDYSDRQRIIYSYRMEGFDKTWNDAGNSRIANYSNLPAGKYVFRVRASSSDSNMGASEASLPVVVLSPLFLRWWAKLLYIGILILCIYLIYNLVRTNRKERYATEMALKGKEEEAHINEMNMSFFANISHEFRTPLTMISGPVNILADDPAISTEKREMLSIVRNNVNRMLRLVSQVMDFSKLEKDALHLMVSQKDIITAVRHTVDSFSTGMEEKKIVMNSYGLDDDFICYFDADKLDKILSNLLSNALKFTQSGGRIELRFDVISKETALEYFPNALSADGQYVKIVVKDSGKGLPVDKLDAIFERFYQINADSQEQYNWGTGLGLYYTRSLVTLHHGAIKAGNRERGGSVFTFVLPVSATAFRREEFASEEETTVQQVSVEDDNVENFVNNDDRHIILVVDDDADVVHYVKSILATEYNVITSFDADEAFKLIEEYAPDIVLSDVIMPGKSGFQLCSMIKGNISFCHIPVILITAKTTLNDQVIGLNSGADAYVTKPFEIDYLKALIKSQLKNRDLSRKMLSEITKTEEIQDQILSDSDKIFMDKLFSLMEKELSNTDLNVNMMTSMLHMSRTKFYYKVKGLTGENPNVFFRQYKLNRAAELIRSGDYNFSEVADLTGFSTLAHFSSCFKKQFGRSPSAFKNENNTTPNNEQ